MAHRITHHTNRLLIVCLMLVLAITISACSSGSSPEGFAALPQGDAERGAALYGEVVDGAPPCTACHALTDEAMAGPGLAGYGDVAANRVDGESAAEYTYYAIVQPARHIAEGYNNLMYAGYGRAYSDQQLADMIAYLLGL